MMISHRFELNTQAISSFEEWCGCDVDLEQADYRADQRSQKTHIVVASVQTLNSRNRMGTYRMERFAPEDFGLLMIDEAHRATSPTYRRVIDHFYQNPNLKLLGVTATPDRLDGVGLGHVFEEVAGHQMDIRWAIDNGWLVPIHQKFVHIEGLDLSNIRTIGGDLDEKQLAKIVEMEQMVHKMAVPVADFLGSDKQGLIFTASVAQSRKMAEVLTRYGVQCGHVDGKTDRGTRKHVIDSYKNGDLQALSNCGVFTEGFDVFHVMAIVSLVSVIGGALPVLAWYRFSGWFEMHYFFMLYSYVGLVMALGSHFFEYLPEVSQWIRAFLFWGLPYIVGTILIYRKRAAFKAQFDGPASETG